MCSKCVNNTFKLTEGFKCVSKVTLSELNCPSGFYEDVNNGSECITCPYDCDEC